MRLALALTLLSLVAVASAPAATLQPIGEFEQPIFVTSDPTDPEELFVVEREGLVIRSVGGATTVFADLTDLVSCCESERGLLSIALAPDFDASGRFYAAYTGTPAAGGAAGDLHVDAFHHEGVALVREPLFAVEHSINANHNGGQLQIGPDGYLYVSVGDGGGGGDPFESGQDLGSLLGKILRIEPRAGAEPQVWSYGLRNPWRFSFDRVTGDMTIADVGQNQREEIDLAASPAPGVVGGEGVNYGWNCREGFIAYAEPGDSCTGASNFTDPVFDYPHADPGDGSAHGCAITGGYVVRDPSLGDLYGRYLYADLCVGEIRSVLLPGSPGERAGDDRSEGLSVVNPVSFGEDSCGRVYVVTQGGAVDRLEGAAPATCPPPSPPPPPPPQSSPSPSTANGSGMTPIPVSQPAGRRSARLSLAVERRRAGRRLGLLLVARLQPCEGDAGATVQLNRGGRPFASKRLDSACVARFHVRVSQRATFRALLPDGDYRSQVRTIALAKPRP
jgi:hypothetical protein